AQPVRRRMMRAATETDHTAHAPDGLPRLLPRAAITSLSEHTALYGTLPPIRSRADRSALVDAVERAGLRGRGGAGFPTARKLRAVADGGRHTVVVANGAEGEPASSKDAVLLTTTPHLVLDGAVVAAGAVRADSVIVVVDRRHPSVVDAVTRAVEERSRAGVDRVPIRVVTIPNRYVAGEETAVVNFLNGGPAKPMFVPPRPFERGVRGRPTLVQNVETMANLALIARFGADWYRSLGTNDEPGTILVTLSGAVERPGVYEFAIGTPVQSVLTTAGTPDGVAALLVGGYFGNWLRPSTLGDVTLSHQALRACGGTLGCGMIGVLGERTCGLVETARISAYLAQESAEQCGPCARGLPALAGAVDAIARGRAPEGTLPTLQRWLHDVSRRGACHLPDGAVGLISSALDVFADDVVAHVQHGRCVSGDFNPVLPLPDPSTRDWSWT
ncbi:MAG TPA: NADH-ubiquinone oxidoreductase-F iron-sulfur binding region domain-containing protein, partial [Acidimicrobiia bacterium]|nr:NADH-ubiquinone oxidoreductase-F iron-sulfur binding region domain-containing protein [Acidimicrobiia bacterium]